MILDLRLVGRSRKTRLIFSGRKNSELRILPAISTPTSITAYLHWPNAVVILVTFVRHLAPVPVVRAIFYAPNGRIVLMSYPAVRILAMKKSFPITTFFPGWEPQTVISEKAARGRPF